MTVTGLSGVSKIATGGWHTCALLSDTTVKCWGNDNAGQLGDGNTTRQLTPVAVTDLSGASEIATGQEFTCSLLTDGAVKCWGRNAEGQLGNGDELGYNSLIPVTVVGLP